MYDDAINIEAIHRIVFNTNGDALIKEFLKSSGGAVNLVNMEENSVSQGSDGIKADESCGEPGNGTGRYIIECICGGESFDISIQAGSIGDMIDILTTFLDEYAAKNGGDVDYIHGEDSLRQLAGEDNTVAFLLPAMKKEDLFGSVEVRGVFPKKSFSIGHAKEKRYYLECRKI